MYQSARGLNQCCARIDHRADKRTLRWPTIAAAVIVVVIGCRDGRPNDRRECECQEKAQK